MFEVESPRAALADLACELARSVPAPLDETTRVFQDWWLPKQWKLNGDVLIGPGGWTLRAGKHTISISHVLRYQRASADNIYGKAMIGGINFFGVFFNASSAIFCHELLPVPDLPIVESAASLSKQFSEATSWEQVQSAHFENGCWMIVALPIEKRTT